MSGKTGERRGEGGRSRGEIFNPQRGINHGERNLNDLLMHFSPCFDFRVSYSSGLNMGRIGWLQGDNVRSVAKLPRSIYWFDPFENFKTHF